MVYYCISSVTFVRIRDDAAKKRIPVMKAMFSRILAKFRPTVVYVRALDLQKRAIDNYDLDPSTRRKA
ncbi:hypothetical protein K2Q08_00125 [Patescibacteria group bacterium]|nr:hypothetical protein [Patescibacteria group bacterium]